MTSLFQSLKLGVKNLALHKMRTGLAGLGIIIGTTTVIWLVAMGEGVSQQAQQQIRELGATNIICRTVMPPDNSDKMKYYGLLRADYDRIMSNIPTIRQSVPMRELPRELRVADRTADAKFVGCTTGYLELNHLSMARGRWFRSRDEYENVIVLAHDTAKRLFPFEDPVGKAVFSGPTNDLYVVIGQTKSRLPMAAIGGSLDARQYNMDAYIPLSTFRRRVGDFENKGGQKGSRGDVVELSQITLTVGDVEDVDVTARVVESLLDKYHDDEDFAVIVPKELLRQAERTRAMFNVLLVVIAGISLLVGGIGIMNIMLANVTERTREIGVRRALGATQSHIIKHFLTETVVLTGSGGLLGVVFGLMCGPLFRGTRALVASIFPDLLPSIVYTLEPQIAPWSVVLSLVIAVGVGLLFGVYPARKAAHLDPIEALRHE